MGSSQGTTTDALGAFTLDASANSTAIILSHISYIADTVWLENTSPNRMIRVQLYPAGFEIAAVQVVDVRAITNDPIVRSLMTKTDIERRNYGQDIPVILEQTPSVVTSSDAGAGVGYTNMRLRGSDQTRINVTINNIPYNDPESHGVFWVNLPDLASSASSIQIQRGVGSSTNGAGAFGGSVHLRTDQMQRDAYGQVDLSVGSYETFKRNIRFGTGLIDGHWTVDGRLSRITSQGYVDRARSDLASYYVALGYYGDKSSIRFIHFAGREETYQAWWGVPESRLNDDEEGMLEHAWNNGFDEEDTENLLSSGRTYNFYTYDNQVDNYGQDHYQVHLNGELQPGLQGNISLFYVRGKGYFEEYKKSESFERYGLEGFILNGDTITESDFIRRRWLDNHFGGFVFNLEKELESSSVHFGGGYNEYVGDHYGRLLWSEFSNGLPYDEPYYEGNSRKADFNLFGQWNFSRGDWDAYVDLQYRGVDYKTEGTDNDLVAYSVDESFNFVNPKLGLKYHFQNGQVHFFYGRTNREPIRSDFIDAPSGIEPKHETLNDFELGYEENRKKINWMANLYYMLYKDQLIPTGALNDVGAVLRENVDHSLRAGIELSFLYRFSRKFHWGLNGNFSTNKILDFTYVLYDYTNGFDVITEDYQNTDIALSPNVILGNAFSYYGERFTAQWNSRYVGRQYLDNTSNLDRSIDAYLVHDLIFEVVLDNSSLPYFRLGLLINNVLGEAYQNFGYTYSYIYGETITENFYYPQALTNVHFRISAGF
jgi:iron complex outermembrane receptor protein